MYKTIDNITFYYEKINDKKNTIIILPGWGNTRETFKYIIEYFKNNYTIYIFDYPAFGNSPIPNKTLTIYDYTKIIYEFIKEEKIINPIIIAHSFGGRISILLDSIYNLKIKKLILIDIAGIKPKKTLKQLTYKLLKKLVFLIPKNKKKQYLNKLFKHFASTDYSNIPISMQKTFKNIVNEDLTKYLSNIKSETLILWGEKDLSTPLKDAKLLEKKINNSALIVLKNASHFSYLNYIYLTNKIIDEFIK